MEDIGYILFVQILRMSQYPGAPFTGDIIRDIVLFFFIPTVFIILFTYMLLGRLFTPGQTKLRLLVGIAIYLFIWASGWYGSFAMLAGPYFIFLIVILGALYFLPSHFRIGSGGGYPAGGGYSDHGGGGERVDEMTRPALLAARDREKEHIRFLEEEIKRAGDEKEKGNLRSQLVEAKLRLRDIEKELNVATKYGRKFRFA